MPAINMSPPLMYSVNVLRSLSSLARTAQMHPLFSLDNITRSKIIALGIMKQRNYIYQRSRGGRNLFHHIHAFIYKVENGQSIAGTNISLRTIKHSNLITIGAEPINSSTNWSEPKQFAT